MSSDQKPRRNDIIDLGSGEIICFSLDQAKKVPHTYLILEGDYGGQTYLTCPVSQIRCSQEEIDALHLEIDKKEWDDQDGMSQYYKTGKVGTRGGGGMGGYRLCESLWFHSGIKHKSLKARVRKTILGFGVPNYAICSISLLQIYYI